MTSDYSKNVCWTCCCALGFEQSISLCKEIGFDNWKYIPFMELGESATDCLVIFDLPIGNSKITIHKTLAKLFTAARKSVIIVTDEETKKIEDCKHLAKRFIKILISALSSTIIMVHIPKQRTKGGGQLLSFLSHSSFFVVILIENMALTLLPSLLPHLYPDKFPWRQHMVISILVLWFFSVGLQEI